MPIFSNFFRSSVRNQIFVSTQRELLQIEIDYRKLGRIMMDSFFNEIMEYSGVLFVIKFVHKSDMLV